MNWQGLPIPDNGQEETNQHGANKIFFVGSSSTSKSNVTCVVPAPKSKRHRKRSSIDSLDSDSSQYQSEVESMPKNNHNNNTNSNNQTNTPTTTTTTTTGYSKAKSHKTHSPRRKKEEIDVLIIKPAYTLNTNEEEAEAEVEIEVEVEAEAEIPKEKKKKKKKNKEKEEPEVLQEEPQSDDKEKKTKKKDKKKSKKQKQLEEEEAVVEEEEQVEAVEDGDQEEEEDDDEGVEIKFKVESESDNNDDDEEDEEKGRVNKRKKSSPEKKENLGKFIPFEFFIQDDHAKILSENEEECLNRIEQVSYECEMEIDRKFQIPDLTGLLVRFSHNKLHEKYKGTLELFDYLFLSRGSHRKTTILCLVPDCMVSLVIGQRGKQINLIMSESRAKIVVNQPINQMTKRTISIEGTASQIARGAKLIYQTIEVHSDQISDRMLQQIQQQPRANMGEAEMNARFAICVKEQAYMNRHSKFVSEVEKKTGARIHFPSDHKARVIRRGDALLEISGKLSQVLPAVSEVMAKIDSIDNPSNKSKDFLRYLIPNRYINKLIGAGGCMIQDIISKAKGAGIKIMSGTKTNYDQTEKIISISGQISSRIEACRLIIQQVEIFKHGGPILISGKNISDNIVMQFKNSLQDKNKSNGDASRSQNEKGKKNSNQKDEEMEVSDLYTASEGGGDSTAKGDKSSFSNDSTKSQREYNQEKKKQSTIIPMKIDDEKNSRSKKVSSSDQRGDSRERNRSQWKRRDDFRGPARNYRSRSRSNDSRSFSGSNSRSDSRSNSRSSSPSRNSKKRSQNKRSESPIPTYRPKRSSPEPKDAAKYKQSYELDRYVGRMRMLIENYIAQRFDEREFLDNVRYRSKCHSIYFDDGERSDKNYQVLIIRGTQEQNKSAFFLINREIFKNEVYY